MAGRRDLGAHIDGWIATQATSLVVQSDPAAPVTGRAADLLAATHTAMEAALRLVRPGHRISAVPEILQKVSGPRQAAAVNKAALMPPSMGNQYHAIPCDPGRLSLSPAMPFVIAVAARAVVSA